MGIKVKVKPGMKGYIGSRVRNEGDVFEIDSEDQLGSWMEVIEKPTKKKAAAKKVDSSAEDDSLV